MPSSCWRRTPGPLFTESAARTVRNGTGPIQRHRANAPYGVHFVEAGTEKVIANPRAFDLVGQWEVSTLDDYRGRVCTRDGETLPKEQWPSRRVMRGETVATEEFLLRTPDGRNVPVLLNAAPVLRPDGQIEGAVVVYEDITTLKELQRLREEWTSIVAHDLRQPLNVITLYINMLQEVGAGPMLACSAAGSSRCRRQRRR